jgi:hypothetical protein
MADRMLLVCSLTCRMLPIGPKFNRDWSAGMCGRVAQKTPLSEIRVLFETVNPVPNAAPTYNAAPTATLPAVRLDRDGRRALDLLRWGLGRELIKRRRA